MADGYNIEDVVILIDVSRSMIRRDFNPSRIQVLMRALSSFIPRKFKIDASDRIGLVTFGLKATKLHDFSNNAQVLLDALKKIKFTGDSDVADGLALSMQMLVTEMRKIGGKVVRIILFSDDRLGQMSNRLIKLANAAKGLGIFIDSLISAMPKDDGTYSVLKNLSLISGGDFAYFNNEQAFLKAAIGLSSKKDLNDISGYWESQEREMHSAPLLSEIAVELKRPDMSEIQEMISNPTKIKCNICYKADDGTGPSYATMRYCPSCGRPMHLNCAVEWSKNSPDAMEDVFRCPFCYFLLKVPSSYKILGKNHSESQHEVGTAKFSKIPRVQIPDIQGSCGNCHVIFLGKYDVYKCNKCGTYYHEPCVKKIHEKYQACRTCGSRITNIKEIFPN
ncbi:VWA domain-containing protein [Candidatus Bathyarchaeota archaeon]|nr:VWA domain-containing protein [Candidatus Bathyarchaeota archaeon]